MASLLVDNLSGRLRASRADVTAPDSSGPVRNMFPVRRSVLRREGVVKAARYASLYMAVTSQCYVVIEMKSR